MDGFVVTREQVEEAEDEVEGLRAMLSEEELTVDESAFLARQQWLSDDGNNTRAWIPR
jgi:hypothetical protein